MSRRGLSVIPFVFAAILLLPANAYADAGIPMLPIAYPVVLLFLLPVIAIEAFYLRLRLGTRWWPTIKGVSIVNAVTLVLGYPLAWVVSLLAQLLLTLIAFLLEKAGVREVIGDKVFWLSVVVPAWLGPVDRLWPILAAFVVLLIPAFLLSGYAEAWMVRRYSLLDTDGECSRAIWRANALSYVFLAVAGCMVLYLRLRHGDFRY
jgi:hypothetical protein